MIPWQYTASTSSCRRAPRVPICTGEDIYLKEDFMPLLKSGGVAVIHPDLLTSGGILETKKIGDAAQDHGVAMAIHMAESPVAAMAAAHVAVATENFLALEQHAVDVPWWDDIAIGLPKPLVRDGFIEVPDKPGLGIDDIDDAVIREHLQPGASGIWQPTDQWDDEYSLGSDLELDPWSASSFAWAEVAAKNSPTDGHDHDRDQGHRPAATQWMAALQEIGAATASSTLSKMGIRSAFICGPVARTPGRAVAGPALTLQFMPKREDTAVSGFSRPSRNCACAGAASATTIDAVTRNRIFMTHLALELNHHGRLLHVDAETHGRTKRHRNRVPLLAKLRMLEHDFMRSDRDAEVADRRLADALPVDPDFRPRRSVQVDARPSAGRAKCAATLPGPT